jgi:hypothetical protein
MESLRILLDGSPRATVFCPVSTFVARSPEEMTAWALTDAASGAPIPFQAQPAPGGAQVHWIVEAIEAGERREYVLRPSLLAPTGSGVTVRRQGKGRLGVTIGGRLFTRYLYGDTAPRPCLYPVLGPFGVGLTRAFPLESLEGDSTDHPHHRSLYVAWGDVNGADLWSEGEGHGRVVHRRFGAIESGPVFGRIVAHNDWLDGSGRRLMQDRLECRFYNTPAGFRLLDLSVTFRASEGDVRFGDTKEGGILSARVGTSMAVRNGGGLSRIENSLGAVGEAETWGRRASWCDYCGPVGDHVVGIAMFDHPDNPRYPTYWHVRDYGLMTANPFGESHFIGPERDGSFVLAADCCATFRYRVLLHVGGARKGAVGQRYLNWIFPPACKVQQ